MKILILVIIQSWTVWIQTFYMGVDNMDNYLIEIPLGVTIHDIRYIYESVSDDELITIIDMINSSDLETSKLGYELFMSYKNG